MATLMKMPQLGLTMKHGTITEWLKKEGDRVEEGDAIAQIESDKSVTDFESRSDGIILKILAGEQETVSVGEPICIIGEEGEDVEAILSSSQATQSSPAKQPSDPVQTAVVAAPATAPARPEASARVFATPAARKYARDNNIPLTGLSGTGECGRIMERDVIAAGKKVASTAAARKAAQQNGVELPADGLNRVRLGDVTAASPAASVKKPFSTMQQVVATRMTQSKQTVPHFYLTADVDCSKLKALRTKLIDVVERRYSARLSYNDIIAKAVALALEQHPQINVSYDDTGIVCHSQINIGLAVALPDGLIVPVLHDVDRLSLGEISQGFSGLVKKARNRSLKPEQYTGGTFTITNLGMYRIRAFQAIVNPPESAILALGAMTEQVVVEDGAAVIRPVMTLSLSCDHRVINGMEGAKFLDTLSRLLEEPEQILC